MTHTHYYRVKADSHFEMGLRLAQLFKDSFYKKHTSFLESDEAQHISLDQSQRYLKITKDFFPAYIEELQGQAEGLNINFDLFWQIYLQEDSNQTIEKCTSCYSSDGLIVGHNEDNYGELDNQITLLEKKLGNKIVFELHYYNSLGGDACSINSDGYVQTINTLHHTDHQIGVPRNIIARWLSETKNPNSDFELMKKIQRSMGYSHTLNNMKGEVVNIESTAALSRFTSPSLPFIHTNHYLTDLSSLEEITLHGNSIERRKVASELIKAVRTPHDMMKLLETISRLESNDKRESKTIARMVFDLKKKEVWCWLQREESLGWINYPLSFL